MKVSDGRVLPRLGDEANSWQPPRPEQNWQDSVVLVWWDLENNIGGYHRIGHEPNVEGGKIALWNNLLSPQGIYKSTEFLPLREEDRMDNGGFGAGDTCRYEFLEGRHVWTVKDGDVSATISHTDFHESVECYPKDSTVTQEFANVHVDIPGAVSGTLTIKGVEYQINGLSFRDRGWGTRDWKTLLSHRWVAGTFGPDFSFLALSWYSIDESIAAFGWVVRGDTVTYAKALDITAYIEVDGAINRGGHVRFELTTGEVFDIECERIGDQGLVSYHHDICCVDVMCRATCNDMVGFCDFETTCNIQNGKRQPTKFAHGIAANGFHPL
jgi:hypothetical protein